MTQAPVAGALLQGLLSGARGALARAITLVESTRADHRAEAKALLEAAMAHTGRSCRIGITGVPGAGKSTTIEALGTMLCELGLKVAVLAIDPTSQRTGGSILGDKTRMQALASNPSAFIRPSPSSGTLGGVTRRTRETLLLCEAAGFDVVIVETVGVGQSETVVADMVDHFLVLMLPNAGDDLQGIKKGVLEVADMIVVNKADLDPNAAEAAARAYRNALHLLAPLDRDWPVPVMTCSGLSGAGLVAVWEMVERHRRVMGTSGSFARRRASQQVGWMRALLDDALGAALRAHPAVRARLPELEQAVAAGQLPAGTAADELAGLFLAAPSSSRPQMTSADRERMTDSRTT
jgi:LAO/AO transport system kinase